MLQARLRHPNTKCVYIHINIKYTVILNVAQKCKKLSSVKQRRSKTQPHHIMSCILRRHGESTIILFLSHLYRSDVKPSVLNIKSSSAYTRMWTVFKHDYICVSVPPRMSASHRVQEPNILCTRAIARATLTTTTIIP